MWTLPQQSVGIMFFWVINVGIARVCQSLQDRFTYSETPKLCSFIPKNVKYMFLMFQLAYIVFWKSGKYKDWMEKGQSQSTSPCNSSFWNLSEEPTSTSWRFLMLFYGLFVHLFMWSTAYLKAISSTLLVSSKRPPSRSSVIITQKIISVFMVVSSALKVD